MQPGCYHDHCTGPVKCDFSAFDTMNLLDKLKSHGFLPVAIRKVRALVSQDEHIKVQGVYTKNSSWYVKLKSEKNVVSISAFGLVEWHYE